MPAKAGSVLSARKGAEYGCRNCTMEGRSAQWNFQYFADRITLDYICTEIANAGFDADTVTAEPDSYKLLPNPCKKPADGNGYGPFKYCNLDPADRPKD